MNVDASPAFTQTRPAIPKNDDFEGSVILMRGYPKSPFLGNHEGFVRHGATTCTKTPLHSITSDCYNSPSSDTDLPKGAKLISLQADELFLFRFPGAASLRFVKNMKLRPRFS
jgi:hypothetical protein